MTMKHNTFYTIFTPKIPPKATLLIVHGMTEHQGRYYQFAQFLAENGIIAMTFDHLGHGERGKQTGKLGFMGNPHPAQLLIDDVMQHAEFLANHFPNLPRFILGHSMGSFITRCLLQQHHSDFSGAILMGTSDANPQILPFIPLTRLLNKTLSKQTNIPLALLLNKLINRPFAKDADLQNFNWLNQNPQHIYDYLKDPLCGFAFTNNGFYALLTLMYHGTRKNWALNISKTLPMLFISGEDDPVGQMGKGIPQIVQELHIQDFADIRFHQYPKMRHDILQEDNHLQVYQDILIWLNNHSDKNNK